MKTVKFRHLLVAGMVTGALINGSVFAADNKDKKNNKENPLTETREHKAIEAQIQKISDLNVRREVLEDCIMEDRQEDNKAALIYDRQELKRTKADLKCEKAYLKADKKVLLENRKAEIKAVKEEKRDTKYALMEAKYYMRRDLRNGVTENLASNAERVAVLEKDLNTIRDREEALRDEKNEYVLYLNEQLEEADGSSLALSSENTLVRLNTILI
jgi:hypothetical protein